MESERNTSPLEEFPSLRLSRRSLLRGVGAGIVGVSLAACSSNSNKNSNTTTGKAATSAPAGAGSAGAGSGTTAATSGTPTFKPPQGASLSILVWSHFIPAYDEYLDKYVKDWGGKNNVKATIDHVSIDDIPGRLAAEVAAGKGHDLFEFAGQVKTRVYEKQLVDFNDIVDGLAKLYGDPIAVAKNLGVVNGKWKVVPSFGVLQPPLVRGDLLKQIGMSAPTSWDEVLKVGAALKKAGHPCGFAVSHCNDANHNWRGVMNSFGASEVGPDGKTITADSKEMREFLGWAKQFGAECNNTPAVFAWDNASDNRYLGSGEGGFIHDAISGLRSIQPQNPPVYDAVQVLPELKGTMKTVHVADYNMWGMWSFTPKGNQEAAKAFLWDHLTHQRENDIASTGYNHPMFTNQFKQPMPVIGDDPKYNVLQEYKGDLLQNYGWPGPANAPAEEVLAQFLIPDMVAKVQQGTSIDDGIKFLINQMKPIYAKYA
ncbi:MAG: ABC transporter substrate-binding protein [Dehalococcoidia bacterium]